MKVKRFSKATRYDAPNHRDFMGVRLQAFELTARRTSGSGSHISPRRRLLPALDRLDRQRRRWHRPARRRAGHDHRDGRAEPVTVGQPVAESQGDAEADEEAQPDEEAVTDLALRHRRPERRSGPGRVG